MDKVFIGPTHSKVEYVLPAALTGTGNFKQTLDAQDAYPDYSKAEIRADAVMHMIGIGGSVGAIFALIKLIQQGPGSLTDQIAVWVYAGVMLIAFFASAFYHLTPWEHLRPLFRRFDHAAIFLKIAGTYTPLVMLIGSDFSYLILGLVWLAALYGMLQKIFFWSTPNNASILLYLGMGWASLAIAWPMLQTIPSISFWLTVTGGMTYTAGVIFYKWESLKFSNAIWHGFVITASSCIYFAIYFGEMAKLGLF